MNALFLIQNINTILSRKSFGLYTVIRTETETLLQKSKALDLAGFLELEELTKFTWPLAVNSFYLIS